MQDTVMLITGSGRSGSSVLSRLLALHGATLPDNIMKANKWNPRGYWEAQDAVDLNDRFLHRFGSAWSDPTFRLQRDADIPEADAERFVGEIENVVRHGFAESPCKIVKDPRITILLDHWIEGVKRAGSKPVVLHTFRDPRSYFQSVNSRDGFGVEHAYALWAKYNILGDLYSRSELRICLDFKDILGDWRDVVARIREHAGLDLTIGAGNEREADDFVTEDLWHNKGDEAETAPLPDIVSFLLRSTPSVFEGDAGVLAAASDRYERYIESETYFRRLLESSQTLDPALLAKLEQLEKEKAAFAGGCEERDGVIREQMERIGALTTERAAFAGGCAERDGMIRAQADRIGALITERAAFADGCEERDGMIREQMERIAVLEREKAAFAGGCEERDGVIRGQMERIVTLEREKAAFAGGCDERDGVIQTQRERIAVLERG